MDKIISFVTVIIVSTIITAVGVVLTHATGWYIALLFITSVCIVTLALRAIAVALYDSKTDRIDFTYDKRLEDRA